MTQTQQTIQGLPPEAAGRPTGIVNPITVFGAERGPDGKQPQDRDEATGLPLWEIEHDTIIEAFDRQTTVQRYVRVPSRERPQVEAGKPVPYERLELTDRAKAYPAAQPGGKPRAELQSFWKAAGIRQPASAGRKGDVA